LALSAVVGPALAATGTNCDQAAESLPLPEPGTDALTFEVVEYTVSDHDAPGRLSVDGSDESGGSGLETDPGPPRVETLLRRIFDETQLRAPDLAEADEPEERHAPMVIDKPESVNSSSAAPDQAESAVPGPHLPGVSHDEFLRFKRQMYRTDI
jgi:hypothetical protein